MQASIKRCLAGYVTVCGKRRQGEVVAKDGSELDAQSVKHLFLVEREFAIHVLEK
jgi:hypothetical protein